MDIYQAIILIDGACEKIPSGRMLPATLQEIVESNDSQLRNLSTVFQNITRSNDSQMMIPAVFRDSWNLPTVFQEKSCFRPSYPLKKL